MTGKMGKSTKEVRIWKECVRNALYSTNRSLRFDSWICVRLQVGGTYSDGPLRLFDWSLNPITLRTLNRMTPPAGYFTTVAGFQNIAAAASIATVQCKRRAVLNKAPSVIHLSYAQTPNSCCISLYFKIL